MFIVKRHADNPLLAPTRERPWEALAAFNPSVVRTKEGVRMYYRALSNPAALVAPFAAQSTIGMAASTDESHFHDRTQVIAPKEAWEAFGCEDPRAVVIDGTTYLSYTALGGIPFSAENIKVAIAISKDGVAFDERHLATPFNAKAFAFFPEKVGDGYAALLSVHTDRPPTHLCLARAKKIEDFWSPEYWKEWYASWESHALHLKRSDEDHVEAGTSPIKTERGWLVFYSYIRHYFGGGPRTFTVEAALLDLEDPSKIIGRTYPFLVPEETYERYGIVPDIVFPTSALLSEDGETVDLYYGAADTVCAKASMRLQDLLDAIDTATAPVFTRAKENPILLPKKENAFEGKLVFNPAALDLDGAVHILYRAMDEANTSYVGYARSKDGIHIDERLSAPCYAPREEFELKKSHPTGNSGVEDPRAVVIDDRVYMTYTAYDGVMPPRGAVSSILVDDFLAKRFENWEKPFLVTPDNMDDKDLALLPEKVDGHFLLYHRIAGRICADLLPELKEGTRVSKCIEIFGPREGMWDAAKVGIAGPPIKVESGFLFLYHGVSRTGKYRVGAALLDHSGTNVLSRAVDPIFEPVESYELQGEVNNVVFPCGAVVRDDALYMYYGGADKVIGVATASLSRIVKALTL